MLNKGFTERKFHGPYPTLFFVSMGLNRPLDSWPEIQESYHENKFSLFLGASLTGMKIYVWNYFSIVYGLHLFQ